jgi:hypothetical protein
MRLDVRFSERPLENLWCEAVVALVFQRKFLTMGLLSGLDAKLGGLLGRLEKSAFWSGQREEDLLVASQGRVKAEKVLLCGLGAVSECGPSCMAEQVERVAGVLDRMHVSDLAIHVPMLEGEETDYPVHLEEAVRRLASPYIEAHGETPDFLLKAVFSIERFFSGPLQPVAERLRSRFEPEFEISVVIEREKREAVGG